MRIASDSTRGLLTTGTLLLDLENVLTSPKTFTLELWSPGGFPRPPRVLRIEPNVIPILQGRTVSQESRVESEIPDWTQTLPNRACGLPAAKNP